MHHIHIITSTCNNQLWVLYAWLQPRALLALQLGDHVSADGSMYCNTDCGFFAERKVRCDANGYVTSIWSADRSLRCFENGVSSNLDPWDEQHLEQYLQNPLSITSFGPNEVDALLTLRNLQAVSIKVTNGTLPAEIGGLTQLRHFLLKHDCLIGSLPPGWHFKHLSTLVIRGPSDSLSCGVTGMIPLSWPSQMSRVKLLYIKHNRLKGPLHPQYTLWRSATHVNLDHNLIAGSIPEAYATWSLQELVVSFNKLTGTLPSLASSTDVGPSRIQRSLTTLIVSNNGITGECFKPRR
jgi:hypothetical protein